MAAYGAVISLKNTIQFIKEPPRILLIPFGHILQPAYDAMVLLQKALLQLDSTGYSKIRTKVNALDERIKHAIWEFEDLLESLVYEQILSQLEGSSSASETDHLSFSVVLQSLQQRVDCLLERVTPTEEEESYNHLLALREFTHQFLPALSARDRSRYRLPYSVTLYSLYQIIHPFVVRVREMAVEYIIELQNMPEEEGEPISSRIDFGGINSNMVGLSDEFEEARDSLLAEDEDKCCLALTGMAGVGKTTLAKKAFDDPLIQTRFEHRAWVRVGRKCELNETLRCILAQVDPNTRDQMLTQGDDDDHPKLVGLLEDRLKDKKCLIVLDDVWKWDTRLLDNLPKGKVRILLTSRFKIKDSPNQVVRLLNEEESKKLLGEKMFGEEGFPSCLKKLGEKIAKKCEGLPLMIVIRAPL